MSLAFRPLSALAVVQAVESSIGSLKTYTQSRLDQDFIVFRGNDHESSGQLLKGVVVLCLSSSLRVEDIRLRLTGTQRLA